MISAPLSIIIRLQVLRRLPARSAFAASGLALGARVEIECQAWAGAR